MKIGWMPRIMWAIFKPSFKKQIFVLGISDTSMVMENAKSEYQNIIAGIPPFGKHDVLLINLLSAAMLAAIYLSLEKQPSLEQVAKYYDAAMSDNFVMRTFLKSSNYYSKGYQKTLSRQAERSQRSMNPYSWKFRFVAGSSLDSFDALFDQCGICYLFSTLGISEIVPAMCAYDYRMAKWTKTDFSREYTLAGGGKICDCHYQKSKE